MVTGTPRAPGRSDKVAAGAARLADIDRKIEFAKSVENILTDFSDRYGADCLFAALKLKAADKGIFIND